MFRLHESMLSFVVLAFCGMILLSMLAMKVPRDRESARLTKCQANLRKLGEAAHNYHSSFKALPSAVVGTTGGRPNQSNQGRLSGFAALLPYIDQQPAWEALWHGESDQFPSMGPSPAYDPQKFKLWSIQFDRFLCPVDRFKRQEYGARSYMMNYGDAVDSVGRLFDRSDPDEADLQEVVGRGAFTPNRRLKFREFLDGLSNTILFGETRVGGKSRQASSRVARGVKGLIDRPALAMATVDEEKYRTGQAVWAVGKGSRWAEGSFVMNGITTVLAPGGPSATMPLDPESGCVSATSYHTAGVNVVMAGGAIRFVSDSIDTGNLNSPSVSPLNDNAGAKTPYGVWGAMGTRSNKEIIPSQRQAAFKQFDF